MTILLKEALSQYVKKIMRLFDNLGFVINFKKSQTVSTQRIRILGFVIDSVKMIVTLIKEKKQKLKSLSFKFV